VHAWTTYPGGQSGNPASEYYRDRIPRWVAGQLDSARFVHAEAEIGRARRALLTLTPP
jgi:acyl-homoserine lactone acylase PvdQ